MRSRTRNRSFILAVLILFSSTIAAREDYLIGYRLSVHNSQLYAETLTVSKAMKPCAADVSDSLILERGSEQPLKETLDQHKNSFLEFASNQTIHIKSNQEFLNDSTHSSDTITLPTQCYAVEFNDASVIISRLK